MKTLRIVAVGVALVSAAAIAGCEKKEPTLGEKVEQTGKTVGELPTDQRSLLFLFLKVFIPMFVALMALFRFVL